MIDDLCRQVKRTQRQIVGTENGFHCGKWPKYPFVWFYAKIGIKCRKTCNGLRDLFKWLVMQENTLDGFECNKIGDNNSKMCVCGTVKVVK